MRAFISYSHDSQEHADWVARFASRIASEGVDVRFDQTHLKYGDDISVFMEAEIAAADFVFVICTPNYVVRSNSRKGGVGYESVILSTEILRNQDSRKFIPVLRSIGSDIQRLPSFLGNRLYLDMTDGEGFSHSFNHLINQLRNHEAGQADQLRNLDAGRRDRRIEMHGPYEVDRLSDQLPRLADLFGLNEPGPINFDEEDLLALFGSEPFWHVSATTTERNPNYGVLAQHAVLQAGVAMASEVRKFRSLGVILAGPKDELKLKDVKEAMNAIRSILEVDAHIIYSAVYRNEGGRGVLIFA